MSDTNSTQNLPGAEQSPVDPLGTGTRNKLRISRKSFPWIPFLLTSTHNSKPKPE